MAKYRKLIVASIGLVLIILNQFFGVSIGVEASQILDFAIPVLTAFGVWAAPNEPT